MAARTRLTLLHRIIAVSTASRVMAVPLFPLPRIITPSPISPRHYYSSKGASRLASIPPNLAVKRETAHATLLPHRRHAPHGHPHS